MSPEDKAYYPLNETLEETVRRLKEKKLSELREQIVHIQSLDTLGWCEEYGIIPNMPEWYIEQGGSVPVLTAEPGKYRGAWKYGRKEGRNWWESYVGHDEAMAIMNRWEE